MDIERLRTIAQAYVRRGGENPKVTLAADDVESLRQHVEGYVDARREAYWFECGFDGREIDEDEEDTYAQDQDALAEQLAEDLRLTHEQAFDVAGLARSR